MTFVNELRDIPEHVSDKLELRTRVFNIDTSIHIDLSDPRPQIVPIQKLRVFYFFCETEEDFQRWISVQEKLTYFLNDDSGKILGHATLQLNQFASGMVHSLEYLQLFSNPNLKLACFRVCFPSLSTHFSSEVRNA